MHGHLSATGGSYWKGREASRKKEGKQERDQKETPQYMWLEI